jgi:hypothetical protein
MNVGGHKSVGVMKQWASRSFLPDSMSLIYRPEIQPYTGSRILNRWSAGHLTTDQATGYSFQFCGYSHAGKEVIHLATYRLLHCCLTGRSTPG